MPEDITYQITLYESDDGWRWRMRPATGGRTVDASTEAFSSKYECKRNAERSTGCAFRGFDEAWVTRAPS
jgi:hypothetical protein